YKKGFHYVIKATKITLKHSPHKDVNVIFEYIETISKKIANKQDSYSEITMEVAPVMISFIPRESEPKLAYLVKTADESRPRPVTRIIGFKFKKGYTYRLRVYRSISYPPLPYSEQFQLLEVMSQHK